MVSVESVSDNLAQASSDLWALIEAEDGPEGFDNQEYVNDLFDAWELVKRAVKVLDKA